MSFEITPRPEIATLQPATHGGLDHSELERLGLKPGDLLDFSVNCNPFGPPPRIRAIWPGLDLERYPDRECLALRAALAKRHQCSAGQIWIGNGTAELIWLLALAYARSGDPLLIVAPTFGEYTTAGALMGARVETFTSQPKDDFWPNWDALAARLKQLRPRLTFLCNPNNPTGVYAGQAKVKALLAANPAGLLVLDEAYISFVTPGWSSRALLDSGQLAVLRSMTKDYALAGLRLGYLLAAANIVDVVRRAQPPWSVNTAAQAAGLAALQATDYVQNTLAQTAAAKVELVRDLSALGLRVYPSSTHFFLVETGNAAATRAGLLQRGVLVRDCTSFGLPAFVRVGTRRPEENQRLVAAWREIVANSLSDVM